MKNNDKRGNHVNDHRYWRSKGTSEVYISASASTIFTILSSSCLVIPACCGHRCCRRRFEHDLRQRYCLKCRRKIRRRYMKIRKSKKSRNKTSKVMKSEAIQIGSRSNMLSPLYVTSNADALAEESNEPILLYSKSFPAMRIIKHYKARADISALALFASVVGADISAPGTQRVNICIIGDRKLITPEIIFDALCKLTMWKQSVPITPIIDYLVHNYPVNNNREALLEELTEKLNVAAMTGIACQSTDGTWSLSYKIFEKRKLTKNHVTLFWKMYADTLKPIVKKKVKEDQGESSTDNYGGKSVLIYDENFI